MRKYVFFILFTISSAWAKEQSTSTICYFSLNNQKEYQIMDQLTQNLKQKSGVRIQVKEFQTFGSDPKESFRKMVESGTQCNGLVISGHHTGSFGGERSQGSLSINFLEQLSCDPNYEDWFKDINALWLQGCRTLGEKIEIDQDISADSHTLRVGAVLDDDHLEQSFADLNMEFSATLDQITPCPVAI